MQRYAQAVDRRDYETLVSLMEPDGVIEVHDDDPDRSDPLRSMRGRAEIDRRMRSIERYVKTWHLIGNHLVEVSGDAATAETYCAAHQVYGDDGATRDRVMYIRYLDELARDGLVWMFRRRRLWVDFETDQPLGSSADSARSG